MLGKSSSKRANILKIIFKLLQVENDHVKIKLARLILAVCIYKMKIDGRLNKNIEKFFMILV